MHGIILKGLKDFVVETYDQSTWNTLCEEAGVGKRLYVPVTEYPDAHVFALVEAAVELSGEDQSDLLRQFGRYLVPTLVQTYGVHVDENWSGLELVENVEGYIHRALRSKNISEFDPPGIDARRVDDDEVLVVYDSDRRLCDVAKGLLEGIGDYYDEPFDVAEGRCMHDGADCCEITVLQRAVVRRSARTD